MKYVLETKGILTIGRKLSFRDIHRRILDCATWNWLNSSHFTSFRGLSINSTTF